MYMYIHTVYIHIYINIYNIHIYVKHTYTICSFSAPIFTCFIDQQPPLYLIETSTHLVSKLSPRGVCRGSLPCSL